MPKGNHSHTSGQVSPFLTGVCALHVNVRCMVLKRTVACDLKRPENINGCSL